MLTWALALLACSCRSAAKDCAEPHLWYAPDASENVYFGCSPPEGWVETPPDTDTGEVAFLPPSDADADADTDGDLDVDVDTDGGSDTAEPPADTSGDTGCATCRRGPRHDDTGASERDTGAAPEDRPARDTAEPEDTGDTGDTGDPSDDTGRNDDQGSPDDTGAPEGRGGRDTGRP